MSNPLMAGFEAGSFTLPDEVVAAFKTEAATQAVLDEQPDASLLVEDARRRFREAVQKAARAGKRLPDGSELIEAKAIAEIQAEALEVLREEARQTERQSRQVFGGCQEEILVEHLRPALEDTIAKARKATEDELPDLASRYFVIRGARSFLNRLVPELDTFGTFAELRDLDRWWPQFYPERSAQQVRGMVIPSVKEMQERKPTQMTPAPWPSDTLARFRWIIDNCDPWLPTPEEQDARFEEYLQKISAERGEGRKRWRAENWVA